MASNQGGESSHVSVFLSCYIPTPNLIHMSLAAKSKRKLRRSVEQTEQSTQNKGSLNTFYSKTDAQEDLWKSLNQHVVTLAIGPAGVGKTLVGLHWGLQALFDRHISKVYYLRSDVGVEHQRGRGALPGDFDQKVAPLMGPVHDNLAVIMKTPGAAEYVMSKKLVEPLLLEDIRGRSLNDCFIVADEAQNMTPGQVKTVLSRVGENSRLLLTGDTKQIDLQVFQRDNGLIDAFHRLAGLDNVGRVAFQKSDIVRNSVIANILMRYDD
jgi:phosphate starvation-inducible protein PhoH and related proteins